MTMPATVEELGGRLPSDDERQVATQLRKILAASGSDDTPLKVALDGEVANICLTPALSHLLMELLRHISRGDAVALVPVGQMLTTQQAADILNVSRPYLVQLLEDKRIPYTKVGRHRRIEAKDLLEYKRQRDAERSGALEDLAQIDDELI